MHLASGLVIAALVFELRSEFRDLVQAGLEPLLQELLLLGHGLVGQPLPLQLLLQVLHFVHQEVLHLGRAHNTLETSHNALRRIVFSVQ